ncbi:hypothetical protein ACLOJK_029017 [Asimina triloba]
MGGSYRVEGEATRDFGGVFSAKREGGKGCKLNLQRLDRRLKHTLGQVSGLGLGGVKKTFRKEEEVRKAEEAQLKMAVTLSGEVTLQVGIEVSLKEGSRVIITEVDDDNLGEVKEALPLQVAGLLGLEVPHDVVESLLEVAHLKVIPSEGLKVSLARAKDDPLIGRES